MKRTLFNGMIDNLPDKFEEFLLNAQIYDSSCSPEARVYYIDKDNGYYLKKSAKGTLETESILTSYFHSKGLGAEVIDFISDENDWLLTSRVNGEDCIHSDYLSDPKRLCDTIAEELRKLHETDFSDCPVQKRNDSYLALAEENYTTGNYDKSSFLDSFGFKSAEEAYHILQSGRHLFKSEVLLHGDYCLPNIMLDNWKFSSFIDLGNGGVGDRHIDIFWGTWTLWFNLKTNKYYDRFIDAYGRDKVDLQMLKIIAAAEVFG